MAKNKHNFKEPEVLPLQLNVSIPELSNAQTFSEILAVNELDITKKYTIKTSGYNIDGAIVMATFTDIDKIQISITNLTDEVIPNKSLTVILQQI